MASRDKANAHMRLIFGKDTFANEKFNSFSTLEQSKYIANRIVLLITISSGIGLSFLIFAKTQKI